MPEIRDNVGESRFEILVEGALAGFSEYLLEGSTITFPHTVVFEEFEGHGYAGQLIQFELDDARSRGLSVMPLCSFVRGWIAKHPDYLDLVPAQSREELGLPAST